MPQTRRIAVIDAEGNDLEWLVALEARPEYARFLHRSSLEAHALAMHRTGTHYLIARADGQRLGYAILNDIDSAASSVELMRMAVTEPGTGIGQPFLHAVIGLAFDRFHANRLWLDVFEDNARGRHTYGKVGFVEEGILREAALKTDGTLGSLVIMSMLARERPAG